MRTKKNVVIDHVSHEEAESAVRETFMYGLERNQFTRYIAQAREMEALVLKLRLVLPQCLDCDCPATKCPPHNNDAYYCDEHAPAKYVDIGFADTVRAAEKVAGK